MGEGGGAARGGRPRVPPAPAWSSGAGQRLAHRAAVHNRGARALRWLLGAGPRRVQLLGLSAFAYAALFAVEGTGLWMQKRWAEYFSIVATSSLLPLEIYEVVKRVTMLRIAVLVSNVAIVAYLVWKVRASRRGLTARE